jgi:hypothetical protein
VVTVARRFIIIIGSAQAPRRHPTSAIHTGDDGLPFRFETPAEARAEIKKLRTKFPAATFEVTQIETREKVEYRRVLAALLLLKDQIADVEIPDDQKATFWDWVTIVEKAIDARRRKDGA